MKISSFNYILIFSLSGLVNGQNNPEELGNVHWLRNYDQAILESIKSSKPIFILFQEVPGCATCRNFGRNVMKHPLVVELIETNFVPLAIHNNKLGADAEILRKFKESSWNNPVIHIVDSQGKDLVPKLNDKYQLGQVITFIRQGIQRHGNIIPNYLKLLEEEYNAQRNEMILEMDCFWSGEKNLAGQQGVIYTEAGFSNGTEVVKLIYDEKTTSLRNVLDIAKRTGSANAIHTNDLGYKNVASLKNIEVKKFLHFSKDEDFHYFLKNSIYAYLPLTPMQASKINSALGNNSGVEEFLSKSQLGMIQGIKTGKLSKKVRYNIDICEAWYLF